MLSNKEQQTIQKAYRAFLEGKSLKARYGQRYMIAAIAKELGNVTWNNEGERTSKPSVTVVEAGTGTGKTLGYTLATIPVAKALNKKLIIATATVALQEQIIYRDLPDIKQHSALEFNFILAKGRRRYVCLSKLDNILQNSTSPVMNFDFLNEENASAEKEDLALYNKMLESFATKKWNGDRDSWEDSVEETQWRPLTATHAQCTNRKCSYFSQCPFFRLRADIDKADVIVTNHDMVLADLHLGGGAILPSPEKTVYIFDEGHHLPAKTLEHFSYSTRLKDSERWLEKTRKYLIKLHAQHQFVDSAGRWLEELCQNALELIEPHLHITKAISEFVSFKQEETTERGTVWSHRFPLGVVPDNLITLAQCLYSGYRKCAGLCEKMSDFLKKAMNGDIPGIDALFAEQFLSQMGTISLRFSNSAKLWELYANRDNKEKAPYARWIKRILLHNNEEFYVHSSMIEPGETLYDRLWSKAGATIVTSATLTALGTFSHFNKKAGIPDESKCFQFPGPFRYAEVAKLNIPSLKTDPKNTVEHTSEIVKILPELLSKALGTLVLFASRRQMWEVFKELDTEIKKQILIQGQHSKQLLLKTHRHNIDNDKPSSIFGLAGLAEGIDLPGRYCEHVIITKIPFAVPDDPVEASCAEWVVAKGGNPFMEITIPDASVRLIQASGRLLRTETDKGTITILDNRLMTKRYGKALINALPPYQKI